MFEVPHVFPERAEPRRSPAEFEKVLESRLLLRLSRIVLHNSKDLRESHAYQTRSRWWGCRIFYCASGNQRGWIAVCRVFYIMFFYSCRYIFVMRWYWINYILGEFEFCYVSKEVAQTHLYWSRLLLFEIWNSRVTLFSEFSLVCE